MAAVRFRQGLAWRQLRNTANYLFANYGDIRTNTLQLRKRLFRIRPCPRCGFREINHEDRRCVFPQNDKFTLESFLIKKTLRHRLGNYSFKKDRFFESYRQVLLIRKFQLVSHTHLSSYSDAELSRASSRPTNVSQGAPRSIEAVPHPEQNDIVQA